MQLKQILSKWDSPYVGLALLCITVLAFVGFLLGWWDFIYVCTGVLLVLWFSAYTAPLGPPGGYPSGHNCNYCNSRRFGL